MSGRMIFNKWYKINNHKVSCISRAQGAKGYFGNQNITDLTLNKHLLVSISIS